MTRIQRLPSPTPIITAVKTCTNHYQPRRSPYVGCVTGAVVSGRHSDSPDSELLILMIARRLLFDSLKDMSCFQSRWTLTLEPPIFGYAATLGL